MARRMSPRGGGMPATPTMALAAYPFQSRTASARTTGGDVIARSASAIRSGKIDIFLKCVRGFIFFLGWFGIFFHCEKTKKSVQSAHLNSDFFGDALSV